jgi:Ankyrin repeats (3 copies)/Ankyrin repeat
MSRTADDKTAAFQKAVWEENVEEINRLIDEGADVEGRRSSTSNTALANCCWNGKLQSAKALIARGANVHARGPDGSTPLHSAALWSTRQNFPFQQKGASCVSLLLASGADAEAKDRRGNRPLHSASSSEVATAALLAHGVQLNPQNEEGKTPLYEACGEYGDAKTIELLLAQPGIDVTVKAYDNSTVLHHAAKGRHLWAAERIGATGAIDPDAKRDDGMTPLMLACTPRIVADHADEAESPKDLTKYALFFLAEGANWKHPVPPRSFPWPSLDEGLAVILRSFIVDLFVSEYRPIPAHRRVLRWLLNSLAARKTLETESATAPWKQRDWARTSRYEHYGSYDDFGRGYRYSGDGSDGDDDFGDSASSSDRVQRGWTPPHSVTKNLGPAGVVKLKRYARLSALREDAWKRRRHLCLDRALWKKPAAATIGSGEAAEGEGAKEAKAGAGE